MPTVNVKWTGIPGSDPTSTPQATDDSYVTSGFLNFDLASIDSYFEILIANLLANDKGGEAKTFYSVDSVASDQNAIIYDQAAQVLRFDATKYAGMGLGATAEVSFNYTIRLSNGTLSTAKVTLQITGENDGPAVSGKVTGALLEDDATTFNLLANASDVDAGAVLHVENLRWNGGDALPAGFTVTGGTLNVDASSYGHLGSGISRTFTITYDVVDEHGAKVAQTAEITVTGTNDAAAISGTASGSVTENGSPTVSGTLAVDDADAGENVFDAVAAGALAGNYGAFTFDNGTWGYALDGRAESLAAGETRTETLTVSSKDGTAHKTITVTMNGANDRPEVLIGAPGDSSYGQASEDDAALALAGKLTVSDVDVSDVVSVSVGGVEVRDGDRAPSGVDLQSLFTVPGGALIDNASTSARFDWTFNAPAGTFDYLAAGEELVLYYSIIPDDGHAPTGNGTGVVTIKIVGTNDSPVAIDASASVDEDQSIVIDLSDKVSDVDGDTLTITAALADPSLGSVSVNGLKVVFTPAENYNGPATINYTVSDGEGGSASGHVAVTVNPVNDAPVLGDDIVQAREDIPFTVNVLANDTDADGPLTADMVTEFTQGANGTVAYNGDGTFTYTGNPNFFGADSFTYTVNDGAGGVRTATVAVNVLPENDAPTADTLEVSGAEDDARIPITFSGSDIDGSITVGLITSLPVNGKLYHESRLVETAPSFANLGPGHVWFVPDPDWNGETAFEYKVIDNEGRISSPATVAIKVAAVNDAPVLGDDTATTAEDTPVVIDVLANDSDADSSLTVDMITEWTQGSHGRVALKTDGTFTYTPNANYNGSDSFTYTVDDGAGGVRTATVNVEVTPVNDQPVLGLDFIRMTEDGGTFTFDVLANDADPDGTTLTGANIVSFTLPFNGALTKNPDGTFSFTPNADWFGNETITYTVDDGAGGVATQTVILAVASVNDAPTIQAFQPSLILREDNPSATTSRVNMLVTDIDGPQPQYDLTGWTQVGENSWEREGTYGTVRLDTVFNTLQYTLNNLDPDTNALNTGQTVKDDFTIRVVDNEGLTASTTVSFTVQGNTDAPAVNVMDFTGLTGPLFFTGTYVEEGLTLTGLAGHFDVVGTPADPSVYGHIGGADVMRLRKADGSTFSLLGMDVEAIGGATVFRDNFGRSFTYLPGSSATDVKFGEFFKNVTFVDIDVRSANFFQFDNILWA